MTIQMPKIHNKTLWSGWAQIDKPAGVIIHNDYGRMSALDYESWLLRERINNGHPEWGIAHYYADRHTIARYVDTTRAAWHAGDGQGRGNRWFIGYEILQSRGPEFGDITIAQFRENEDMTLRQAAEDMQFWGLPVNRLTVQTHNHFTSTSCPHLSQSIHGDDLETQDFFINRIKHFISKGKTVQDMIKKENEEIMAKEFEKTFTHHPDKEGRTTLFKRGDKVRIRDKATHYVNGREIDTWIKSQNLIVDWLNKDGTVSVKPEADKGKSASFVVTVYDWDLNKA